MGALAGRADQPVPSVTKAVSTVVRRHLCALPAISVHILIFSHAPWHLFLRVDRCSHSSSQTAEFRSLSMPRRWHRSQGVLPRPLCVAQGLVPPLTLCLPGCHCPPSGSCLCQRYHCSSAFCHLSPNLFLQLPLLRLNAGIKSSMFAKGWFSNRVPQKCLRAPSTVTRSL